MNLFGNDQALAERKARKSDEREYKLQERRNYMGIVSPLADRPIPPSDTKWRPPLHMKVEKKLNEFSQGVNNVATRIYDSIMPKKKVETQSEMPRMPQAVTPTQTPSPTPIPNTAERIEPYPVGPGTPDRNQLYSKLQAMEKVIQPEVYDAIMKNIPDDYKRRLALSTVYQESTGGLSPFGDHDKAGNPRSFGPAHMQPGNAPPVPGGRKPTREEALDPEYTAKFLNDFMNYNELGMQDHGLMRRWNYNSGYQGDLGLKDEKGNPMVNGGPRYDEDIPRAATMSAFIRGKKK